MKSWNFYFHSMHAFFKFCLISGFFIFSIQKLYCTDAFTSMSSSENQRWEANKEIKVRMAAAYTFSSRFREIYSKWRPEVQLEGAGRVGEHWWIWVNGAYMWADGRSVGRKDKTTLDFGPLTLGIKYVYHIKKQFNVYVGGGGSIAYLHIKNRADFVKKSVNKWGVGGVIKSGIYCMPYKRFFIDVFLDILYQDFSGISGNMGGVRLGIGLVRKF